MGQVAIVTDHGGWPTAMPVCAGCLIGRRPSGLLEKGTRGVLVARDGTGGQQHEQGLLEGCTNALSDNSSKYHPQVLRAAVVRNTTQ